MPRRLALRRPVLVLAPLCLALTLVGLQLSIAAAGPPGPAQINVLAVSSTAVQAPVGTPGTAVPYVLVAAGGEIQVSVEFRDSAGALASFTKDTPLVVTADTSAANQPMPHTTWVAPAGATGHTLTTALPQAANQVRLTVAVAGTAAGTTATASEPTTEQAAKGPKAPKGPKPSAPTPGTTGADQLFDVLRQILLEESGPGFVRGIGGDGTCAAATPAEPVCGVLLLPNGAVSSQVLLSLGLCDSTYAGCDTRGSVVQTLAALDGLYTKTSPATIVMKCDKSLCPGGAVHKYALNYSLAGNAALSLAEPCPAKNTIGDSQEVCIDYVQSQRDGSGDTHLYLLFTKDARVSWR